MKNARSFVAKEAERRSNYWYGVTWTANNVLVMHQRAMEGKVSSGVAKKMFTKSEEELELCRKAAAACEALAKYLKNASR